MTERYNTAREAFKKLDIMQRDHADALTDHERLKLVLLLEDWAKELRKRPFDFSSEKETTL